MKLFADNSFGFTLIELMVVTMIILTISGISFASYFKFSERQSINNDVRNFATEMRKVQALAKNFVYPAGCTGLIGYNLVSDCFGALNCKSMTANAVCENGNFLVIQSEAVLNKSFFPLAVDVNFEVGSGNINPVRSYNFSNTSDPSYVVEVTTDVNGNIDVREL